MNERYTDAAVAALVGATLLAGGVTTWQAYRQWQAFEDHMGMDAAAMHGTHPVWYLLGTILVASVVGGMYLLIRDRLVASGTPHEGRAPVEREPDAPRSTTGDELEPSTTGDEAEPAATESTEPANADELSADDLAEEPVGTNAISGERSILELLPEDERRILEPTLESPGLTQIELRDRSDFSKSKVSQTVSDLEKRGLLYREPQGRTYRVYPSEELERAR